MSVVLSRDESAGDVGGSPSREGGRLYTEEEVLELDPDATRGLRISLDGHAVEGDDAWTVIANASRSDTRVVRSPSQATGRCRKSWRS